MAFNPIPGFPGSTSTAVPPSLYNSVDLNSTAVPPAPAPAPAAPAAASWAPEISPDAVGLPRLDTVLHRTIAGNDVTITQGELERLTLRSNSVWRLQAAATIERLEREVAELRTALMVLVAGAGADTSTSTPREEEREPTFDLSADAAATNVEGESDPIPPTETS